MKPLIALLLLLVSSNRVCFAQGQILFANYGGGVNAPITNAAGNLIDQGSAYAADLFWSTNLNTAFDALTAAGFDQPFAGSGYFISVQNLQVGAVNTHALGQVRAWDTTFGSTYYQARDNGGEFGFSNLIDMVPQVPPNQPWPLSGLKGFQLQRLPHLRSTSTKTNTIVLSWPTEQTSYAVQQNPDLSPTNWVTLSNTPVTAGQEQQVVLPVPPTGRIFYRLVSQ